MTERAALKKRGFSKGGRQVPLWNEIIELYPPLPYRKAIDYRPVNLREGVSERQWRSAANRPSRQARRGVGIARPERGARRDGVIAASDDGEGRP